ncbi:IS200/IS605 family transposase [Luteolibacter sp. LG18]|uniref:IS200/IS605 family transposase n=1 Tax=Luteolibacter sp. LG18 TaxID=2819286 RepID=UPI002B27FA40|nr:transposase [Luteolibacter sp. LG18]
MPSTFSALHVHVIFSTKERLPLILAAWKDRLHGFMTSILIHRDVEPLAIGGVTDHVHLLLRLKPIHSPAEIVRELKSVTSKWIREERLDAAFAWQEGYGAISVSPSNVRAVCRYIENQEEHHRGRTTEEEFQDFLKKVMADSPR